MFLLVFSWFDGTSPYSWKISKKLGIINKEGNCNLFGVIMTTCVNPADKVEFDLFSRYLQQLIGLLSATGAAGLSSTVF